MSMVAERKSPHVIRSVRIPVTLDRGLRKAAEEMDTSVNSLVESTLQKFVDFDRHAEEFGYASVRKGFLVKLLDYLSDEQIRDLGDWAGRGLGSETIAFHHPTMNLDAVLSTYQNIWAKYSGMYSIKHEKAGNGHVLRLIHNMGSKWSLFFDSQLKAMFDKNLGIELETELSPNLVMARFTV